jgi:DivIVA domain-containing protein
LTPADIHGVRFAKPPFGRRGYDEEDVDALLDEAEGALQRRLDELAHPGRSVHPIGLTADDLRNVVFRKPPIGKRGYVEDDVDAFLDLVARSFETLDSDLANRR